MGVSVPLINGHRYSFASIECSLNGIKLTGIKNVSYKNKLTPGDVYGTASKKLGRTRGKAEPDASIELYKSEAIDFLASLIALAGVASGTANRSVGYGEVAFDVILSYGEYGSPTVTDKIVGARVIEDDDSHSEGTDALTVKFSLNVMDVLKNGVSIAGSAVASTSL